MRRLPSIAGTLTFFVLLTLSARAEPVLLSDGDSFTLGYQRYRLYGIDAPELHQECNDAAGRAWPCGTRARSELRRLIGTNPVECRAITADRFGRVIATCTAGGRDLAEEMVRIGFATAYAGNGLSSPYEQVQLQARTEKRGLWAGTFEMPHDWRRNNPRSDEIAEVLTPRDWLDRKAAELRKVLSEWLRSVFGR